MTEFVKATIHKPGDNMDGSSEIGKILHFIMPAIFKAYEEEMQMYCNKHYDDIDKIDTRDLLVSLISSFALNACIGNIPLETSKEQAIKQSKELMDDVLAGFNLMIGKAIESDSCAIGRSIQ